MAKRAVRPSDGETRFGRLNGQGILYVESGEKQGVVGNAGKGSVLALDARDASGNTTTVYLWASADGKLRTGTTFPTDTESGTVVGTQA